MPNYRVSMDIGGTFTDVVAYDEDAGTYAAGKASTTPGDLSAGVFAGLESVVDRPSRHRLHGPRHDAGPERVPATPRRCRCCCWPPPGARTSTTSPAAPGSRSTTSSTASPTPLVAAQDVIGDRRPARLRRARNSSRWTRTAVRAAARRVSGRGLRRGRRRVPVQLPQPGARAPRPRDPARGAGRRLHHLPLARGGQGMARIRAHLLGRRRGLHRPGRPPLPRSGWKTKLADRGLAVPLHVMQSTGGIAHRRVGARAPAADAALRSGRRRHGRRRAGRRLGRPQPHLRRHGRHQLRRLAWSSTASRTSPPRRPSKACRC